MTSRLLSITLAICLLLLSGAAALAADQPSKQEFLADQHLKLGLTCASCHGKEKPKDVAKEQCLSCHGSYQELAKRTAKLERNPHDSHYTDLECTTCHHGHKENEDFCASCHNQ